AFQLDPSLDQRLSGAFDVIYETTAPPRAWPLEIEFLLLPDIFRAHAHPLVGPSGGRDVGPPLDGHGHHEALVVIRVLADEVDAARCGKNPRPTPIARQERASQ